MSREDQSTLREWLDLGADGQLAERDRWQLDREIEDQPELQQERSELVALNHLLAESRIGVRSGFAQQVVKSLPAAGWETKSPRSWKLVAALLVLLGGLSAALVGTGSARLAPESAFLGAFAAVVDLFRATALAGAGMLQASWRGLGLAMGEMVRGSVLNWLAFALIVVGLNALFILQLRGQRRAASVENSSLRGRGGRES